MSAELFGVIGAVVGAMIAGFAAYLGPIRAQRQVLEAQARRDQLTYYDTKLQHLAALRTAPRHWYGLIQRAADDLLAGRQVDPTWFDSEISAARREVAEVQDGAWRFGLFLRQTPPGTNPREFHRVGADRPNVTEALESATSVVRLCIGTTLDQDSRRRIQEALDHAEEKRGALAQLILDQVTLAIDDRARLSSTL
ncbi:hypothetical protein OG216_19310 [Streptomycetaceae bacterium NBC_01309]